MRVAMAESTLHAQRQLVQARKLVFPAFLRLSMVDEVRRRLLSLCGVTNTEKLYYGPLLE